MRSTLDTLYGIRKFKATSLQMFSICVMDLYVDFIDNIHILCHVQLARCLNLQGNYNRCLPIAFLDATT